MGAPVDLDLTVRTGVARGTGTRVRALPRIEAGPSVPAGAVVGAVVQVLVAEETAPTFVAQAVPGFLARAVQAPGVPLTFVAQPTLPAAVASETVNETPKMSKVGTEKIYQSRISGIS